MLFLALRQLLARKRQTLLVLLGISLGTMMFLVISGVQTGLQSYILTTLLNNVAHVSIQAHEEPIEADELTERMYGPDAAVRWIVPPSGKRDERNLEYPQGWFERLARDPRVLGWSSGLLLNALATRGVTTAPVQVFGIEPESYIRVTRMQDYMREGSLLDLQSGGAKLVLGRKLMERLGTRPGETLLLAAARGEPTPFRVQGWFHSGVQHVDEGMVYVALPDAQKLNRTPGRLGLISVYLVDPTRAREVAAEWAPLSRDKVESWEEMSGNFLQVFTIQRFTRLVITFAILIVAAFGTYNVLSILVNQKKREIAILRSVGYPPASILRLFLLQGLLLGTAGAAVGLGLGHATNLVIRSIDLGFDTGLGTRLPVSFDPRMYLTGLGLALLSAGIASYLPARAAARLTPLDIIRSEG